MPAYGSPVAKALGIKRPRKSKRKKSKRGGWVKLGDVKRNPRRRSRRRLRRNPSGKSIFAVLIGAGLAGAAWHMYAQAKTGQGANIRDPYFLGVVGAGSVAGYLVGRKL